MHSHTHIPKHMLTHTRTQTHAHTHNKPKHMPTHTHTQTLHTHIHKTELHYSVSPARRASVCISSTRRHDTHTYIYTYIHACMHDRQNESVSIEFHLHQGQVVAFLAHAGATHTYTHMWNTQHKISSVSFICRKNTWGCSKHTPASHIHTYTHAKYTT